MSCMILCCLECYYVMHLILPFFIFMHLHLASHLGTLDEPREGRDVGAETEDGVWWIQKMEGLSKCWDGRCSPSECHLTNTNLVLDPRQAPEHSKPPMFSKYQLESFYVDALSTKGWLEQPAAYTFLVKTNISWILCRSKIEYMLSHA